MCYRRAKTRQLCRTKTSGQVALEYVLAMLIVAGLCSATWFFVQGFAYGNLYGSAREDNPFYHLKKENKALGLEGVVLHPFP